MSVEQTTWDPSKHCSVILGKWTRVNGGADEIGEWGRKGVTCTLWGALLGDRGGGVGPCRKQETAQTSPQRKTSQNRWKRCEADPLSATSTYRVCLLNLLQQRGGTFKDRVPMAGFRGAPWKLTATHPSELSLAFHPPLWDITWCSFIYWIS